ncbi:restriction endonuclease subunit S [Bacillus wiedmannii]|uniref:restriction endonuclease subunit S n=1 Tax=Bacillus wiedmannii TaxID=1890302 RepID=UPI00159BBFC9|nr:restriction endonuclease subunit S [Bacillus wiedmannii]
MSRQSYKLTKVGEIPINWDVQNLEEISEDIFVGIATSTTEHYRQLGVPILRNQNIKEDKLDTKELLYISEEFSEKNKNKKLLAGDVIIVRTGYPGVSCVVPESYEGAQTFTTLVTRPIKTIIHPYFLSRYINSETGKKFVLSGQAGGAQKNLNVSVLKKLVVPVPPINEQVKINEILSSVDDAIGKTEFIIEQTEKVKKGLMQQLLTKGIGHTKFKKTKIGEIPEAWNIGQLDNLTKAGVPVLKTGPFGSSLKSEHFTNQGIPVINIANLLENGLDTDNLFYVSKEKADELRGYQVQEGDVLFSRVADIGRSVVVPESANGWIMSSNLMRIRIDSNKVLPEYLYFQIVYGTYVLRQLKSSISDAGRPVVNSKVLNSLNFPIPSLEEQEEIVNTLLSLNKKIQHENNKMEIQLILKNGLMQSILTGKVRVKVDEAEVTQV